MRKYIETNKESEKCVSNDAHTHRNVNKRRWDDERKAKSHHGRKETTRRIYKRRNRKEDGVSNSEVKKHRKMKKE